ncbi:AAA family ATPase [Marinoscillum sp.]|uniref:AAA family ATPase n=1 Tax=Marinoscillum sp. TaxID=2024838 RepID=UPI003BA87B23
MNEELKKIEKEVSDLTGKLTELKQEIHKVIVGQEEVLDQLIVAMLASGHILVEGMPGLAKTLMIKSVSQALSLKFKRIQFTPDLMPTDILGTEVIEEDEHGHKKFKYNKGPIFSNIVLADEINRTPPKTQAALLEVMQEYSVTYGGTEYAMDRPFFILATQNPVEQSGTFPLPEAQTDRFLLYVLIGYPTETEETQILKQTTGKRPEAIKPVMTGDDLIKLQQYTREVHIEDELIEKVSKIVRLSRPESTSVEAVMNYIDFGAGPRAGQAIILSAKAHALMNGRLAVTPKDITSVVYPAMRHRMILNFRAESEGVSTDQVISELINASKII